MLGPANLVDLDAYLRARVRILNTDGGRGYDGGVRAFDCPLCGDARGRGWLHVLGFAAGCWNAGCPAEPRLPGGAVEWVRRAEGFRSRGEAWALLHREYPRLAAAPPPPDRSAPPEDFCRLPEGLETAWGTGSAWEAEALAFLKRQWNLGLEDARVWGLGRCRRGRYAWRVVVPVVMGGLPVSFLARTVRGAEPRYLNARHGPPEDPAAECGRPAAALLFNADALREGCSAVLVEGAGDAMALARRPAFGFVPVGLLGQVLTVQKTAALRAARPARVVVALDVGPAEARRAQGHAADLQAWGIDAAVGEWRGAKDAGAGAELKVLPAPTLRDRVLSRDWVHR